MSKGIKKIKDAQSLEPLLFHLRNIRYRSSWVRQAGKTISDEAAYVAKQYGLTGLKAGLLRCDMLFSLVIHGVYPSEYSRFRFYEKAAARRREYVTDIPLRLTARKLNRGKTEIIRTLQDKLLSYEALRPFYGRSVVLCSKGCDMDELRSFLAAHDRFILKPRNSNYGRGIRVVELDQADKKEAFISEMTAADDEYVLEELIDQDPALKKIHPGSVNTVRAVVWNDNGAPKIIFTMLRMGVGQSVIDNASAGGLFALADPGSGVLSAARNRRGGEFPSHPDTGERIAGIVIPRWDELLKLLEDLAAAMPEPRLIGWDLALSRKGWVVVEGNHGPAFSGGQICLDRGIKKDAEKIMGIKIKQYL